MTPPRYTDEQQTALETRRVSVALDAGAGCGKTFVLTERFLSHLDPAWERDGHGPPAELDELVAITFTDAAAREMRDRIRTKCRERLAAAPPADAPFWRRLLRSLDGARVSTIHSFSANLVRQHAIELGIDPAFGVVDPAAAQVMRGDAIDGLLRDRMAPRRGVFDEGLIDAAAQLGVVGLRDRLRTLADNHRDPVFRLWAKASPDDCVEAWLAFYRDEVAPGYAAELSEDSSIGTLRELMTQATPVKPEFVQRLVDLDAALDALTQSDDADAALKRLQPLLFAKDPATKKFVYTKKDWPDGDLQKRFTAALKALRERLEKQRRAGDPESMRRAAELGLRLLRLAGEAADRYTRAKRDAGLLDQDDLLAEARRLLTDETFSDARRRIASRVRVLLVDEFQDTDRTQVDIVRAIVGQEPMGDESTDEDDALGSGRLFFVGDFKQSIYRFRGAEPAVFRELRAATPAAGRLPLSQNFRSQPAVIDFVNSLFSELFGEDYAPLRPALPQVAPRPAVELLWTPTPTDGERADGSPREASVEVQRRAEARTLAARLRRLLEGGEEVVVDKESDAARAARPGDVALLFRALSDVPLYEEALREAGLDYYLVGGHAFYAQQEVFDVMNLLRAVDSACDDIALAGALRSPFFGLPDETLFWLAGRGGLNRGLFAAEPPPELDAPQRDRVAHTRGVIGKLRSAKDRLRAAELLRMALDQTGYDAALLAEFLGERKLANLDKLHEQARLSDAAGGGLSDYLRRLVDFTSRPPKEALAATSTEDDGVVRLMTIHRSKGLEFPIVVLPDLNRPVQPDRSTAAFDPRLGPLVKPDTGKDAPPVGLDFYRAAENVQSSAEQDRLFYVACTRAADRLILSSCLEDPTRPKGPWLKQLAKRFDLATGERVGPPHEGEPDGPLVTVVAPKTEAKSASPGGADSGTSLSKMLEQVDAAAGKAAAAAPSGVAPIAINPADLVTFSVSRLSGKLHRTTGEGQAFVEAVPSDERIDPRRLGTLVHAVIERLDPQKESHGPEIERWSRSLAPLHLSRRPADGADACRELVRSFVVSDRWRSMTAAPRLEREVEFLLAWPPGAEAKPTARLQGYIDALYQDASGEWRLVDYKTNQVTAAGVAKEAESYRMQLAVYALAVEAALGVRPASLVLSFLRPGVDHEFPWDDAERRTAIEQINAAIAEARGAANLLE